MRSLARFLLTFSLVVWLGGIIFFSFVVAPALFAMLPNSETAGAVVRVILVRLHLVGIACGVLFIAATFVVASLRNVKALRSFIGLMVLLTALSQFGVMPQMERIRDAVGGSIQALPPQDAGRAAFDRLHKLSVVLDGATLLAGMIVVGLLSREQPN
jgi:uncharacterized membrane protein